MKIESDGLLQQVRKVEEGNEDSDEIGSSRWIFARRAVKIENEGKGKESHEDDDVIENFSSR